MNFIICHILSPIVRIKWWQAIHDEFMCSLLVINYDQLIYWLGEVGGDHVCPATPRQVRPPSALSLVMMQRCSWPKATRKGLKLDRGVNQNPELAWWIFNWTNYHSKSRGGSKQCSIWSHKLNEERIKLMQWVQNWGRFQAKGLKQEKRMRPYETRLGCNRVGKIVSDYFTRSLTRGRHSWSGKISIRTPTTFGEMAKPDRFVTSNLICKQDQRIRVATLAFQWHVPKFAHQPRSTSEASEQAACWDLPGHGWRSGLQTSDSQDAGCTHESKNAHPSEARLDNIYGQATAEKLRFQRSWRKIPCIMPSMRIHHVKNVRIIPSGMTMILAWYVGATLSS